MNSGVIGISEENPFPFSYFFFEIVKHARIDTNILNSALSARTLPGQILDEKVSTLLTG